tara:strand:+ start:5726 stop:6418 length:693 start_codon:yes stop_codon:yes gene_type:complete
MKYNFHLTEKSSNKKVGPIPVSTTSAVTCPNDCPFNNANEGGCYAEAGPLKLHWMKVTSGERGGSFAQFLDKIRNLKTGQLWRHNQAGDLPGNGEHLDGDGCEQLTAANKGKRGFTYTHYDPTKNGNGIIIKAMNKAGFVVNLSGNDPEHAVKLANKNIAPVVSVATSDTSGTFKKGGKTFVQCPATMDNVKIDCATCKLCAVSTRKSIVYFPAHGTMKKRVNNQLNKEG